MDDNLSTSQAFAIASNTIIAVGSDKEITALAGPNTLVTDLQGKVVVPGFIDAHCHPRPEYPFESVHGQVNVNPDHTPTIEDLVQEFCNS